MKTAIDELTQEVESSPRDIGARIRLAQALIELGDGDGGASQLQLASKMSPYDPHIALMAVGALIPVGRAREGALLLSAYVRPQTQWTLIAQEELSLLEQMMHHEETFVRCHTARAIGRLRIGQCREALIRGCQDGDSAVRFAAHQSLHQLDTH